MGRYFEKISFAQFKKDVSDDKELYESYTLPARSTRLSAGYDFKTIEGFALKPKEIKKVPTGIKVKLPEDEFLMLIVRSSMGFKYNVRLCNQIGIIDADFYNNPENEGHIWISIQNEGDKVFEVAPQTGICQGIFQRYYCVDNEPEVEKERDGWTANKELQKVKQKNV